mmetsp:Transcript_12399/g.34115  ORF Transcript_12399/g.34115 Transcript_12399/m.34115 type:complete len:304 (-) Transcript_12399:938-1849(-)
MAGSTACLARFAFYSRNTSQGRGEHAIQFLQQVVYVCEVRGLARRPRGRCRERRHGGSLGRKQGLSDEGSSRRRGAKAAMAAFGCRAGGGGAATAMALRKRFGAEPSKLVIHGIWEVVAATAEEARHLDTPSPEVAATLAPDRAPAAQQVRPLALLPDLDPLALAPRLGGGGSSGDLPLGTHRMASRQGKVTAASRPTSCKDHCGVALAAPKQLVHTLIFAGIRRLLWQADLCDQRLCLAVNVPGFAPSAHVSVGERRAGLRRLNAGPRLVYAPLLFLWGALLLALLIAHTDGNTILRPVVGN